MKWYDTREVFPPDDTGYGFDNIGAVLSISPLLLEKYEAIADEAQLQVTAAGTKAGEEELVKTSSTLGCKTPTLDPMHSVVIARHVIDGISSGPSSVDSPKAGVS